MNHNIINRRITNSALGIHLIRAQLADEVSSSNYKNIALANLHPTNITSLSSYMYTAIFEMYHEPSR